jgi:hypothetical protein
LLPDSDHVDLDTVREAWVKFLSGFGFQGFYTQTFAEPIRFPRLAMDRGWRILRALAGRYGVGVRAFLVAEQHVLGTYHTHGLVMTFPVPLLHLPGSLRFVWMLGFERYGLCRLEDIRSVGGVCGYVAKYITKRIADYDVYEIAPDFTSRG